MHAFRRWLCLLLLLAVCVLLTGCGQEVDPYEDVPNPIATITMEDGTTMRFELYLKIAPNTVANFCELANKGYYDGLEFFRVYPGVLIQSGDKNNDGTGYAGYTIKAENTDGLVHHYQGVISMARLENEPDSASSQFFIMVGNYPEYDDDYTAFGMAMDAETIACIRKISSERVDTQHKPYTKQVIQTVRVNTHGAEFEVEKIEKKKEK